jgi:hypothetical protein
MRSFIVTHRGVPVGRIESLRLTSGDLAVGELAREAGYAVLQPLIRAASRSLWSVGFLSSAVEVSQQSGVPLEVLGHAAELELELCDDRGVLVPTDFVNIVERPSVELPPVVFARLRLAPAATPAELSTQSV